MGYFPFYVNVKKSRGIVVGGGKIAADKVRRLLGFEAGLTVVAPVISGEIWGFCESAELTLIERPYESRDLDGADYVIAATGDHELNRRIRADAGERHLPVNVVDAPDLCDFLFPAVMRKGRLVVSVSTGGASPYACGLLRDKIAGDLPDNIEEVLDILEAERRRVREEIPDRDRRRKYLRELARKLLAEADQGSEMEI